MVLIPRRAIAVPVLVGAVALLPVRGSAQSAAAGVTPPAVGDDAVFAANEPARNYKTGKVIHARRITGAPPQIDGQLNDEVWNGADAATGFVQRDPDNGKAMTEETRIQIAYDSRNLYIAVTCMDSGQVSSGLGRRDETPPTDIVNIGLDPRHDHLTGYIFQTNPSSWQGDMSVFDDDNADRDYNANWEVRSRVTDFGWTAEFRIPFSQLRFTAQPTPGQVWGFDALRTIRRKGETGFWVPRPRGERGDASRYGHVVFDEPLTPPGRLEVTPYSLGRATYNDGEPGDFGGAVGADVRYGLGPGSTLSATINPDFGQVEQDPAVLNLSIYESFFPEKRPFFLEDSRTFIPPYGLFQVFHSRRIGRSPGRFGIEAGDSLISQPADTTIIGAAKLTGKKSGWTYGALTAETSNEYADVTAAGDSSGISARDRRLIEPATSYNVIRMQKDVRGSSNIGVIATGVMRENSEDAYVGGFDYNLRWSRSRNYLNGHWVITHAPGADGMRNGFGGVANVGFNRKHGNGGIHVDHFGTNFRVTDLGFLRTRTNRNRIDGNVEISQPDPGTHLRQYGVGLNGGQSWNDAHLVFERSAETYFFYQFLNYWRGHVGTGGNFERMDDRDTRGGPPIVLPHDRYIFFHVESDSRRSWQWVWNFVGGRSRVGSTFTNYSTGVDFQPSQRLQSSISINYNKGRDDAQWISGDSSGNNIDVDLDGVTDYVYGTLKRNVVDITMRATYAFTRDLTLQAYLQPFVATGDYFNVRRLARPGSYEFAPVTVGYNPDFNDKSLHSNVVMRWEYKKGSTLYIVWNMQQADDSRAGTFSAFRDLGTAFGGGHADNVFMVKATYWMNR